MSELYGTTFREHARPEAISATLAGSGMLMVSAGALGFFVSRDLAPWMRLLSRIAFVACIAATIGIPLFAGSVSPVNIFVSLLNIFSR